MKSGRILVVDDNQGIRSALKILLSAHFAQVELIPSPVTLVSVMDSFKPDVVLLDMNFSANINTGGEGLFWTAELRKMYPHVQIVLFTAYADIALAVEGMKRGAFDFIVKPWNNEKLISTLKAAASSTLGKSVSYKTSGQKSDNGSMHWGTTSTMEQIRHTVEKIAKTDATILITGENGTGKDVLANEIHSQSLRKNRPFICVDAGALTETLFESELFGHMKGAFTDAYTDHKGKFELADGGTLFLDEIGNIPLHLQAKLLRVIQNRTIVRIGSEKPIPVDIHLICATNMDLEQMVREGRFREDLYYRINTIRLHLPPLRERRSDIVPLAMRFVNLYADKYHRAVSSISTASMEKLENHPWEGNIRELQNVIEKAVIMSEGAELLPQDIMLTSPRKSVQSPMASGTSLDEAEEQAIRAAMESCSGNLTMVARQLGISRPTLYSKLRKYNI